MPNESEVHASYIHFMLIAAHWNWSSTLLPQCLHDGCSLLLKVYYAYRLTTSLACLEVLENWPLEMPAIVVYRPTSCAGSLLHPWFQWLLHIVNHAVRMYGSRTSDNLWCGVNDAFVSVLKVMYKKAQLTQRERATAVHVWRPTANKCKIRKNLYSSAQGHSRSLLLVSIETRVWLPISD